MKGRIVYLDSSAIVKRYIKETNTDKVDEIFKGAETRTVSICFSLWNIGEVVAVFDKRSRTGVIKLKPALDSFINETRRLISLGSIETVEVSSTLIFAAVGYVLKYHIYIADAIQVASCKDAGCSDFVTADRSLHEAAQKEGINSILLEEG